MQWELPGTVLCIDKEDGAHIETLFKPMFLGGGMMLSQVAAVTGLEPYAIQNWVKRGFLPPPVNKRYNLSQLCRVININMLKTALSMEKVCDLLAYVNGRLEDTRDDLIGDAQLYFMFVKPASRMRTLFDENTREAALQAVMAHYEEPAPGAKQGVEKALSVMLTAWLAGRMQKQAETMLSEIENKKEL